MSQVLESSAEMLDLAGAARLLSLTRQHVASLIHSGDLRGYDVSNGKIPRWRIAREDLAAFLASRMARGSGSDS